ncbi:BspA family leucine-rich repeat surface protein [Lacticaseibacillus salsurivasis]|uniref:BspA family leucine-rich repeat surface protein n=1 Tax=Lacticaseibacillus salsurivasis TaxID=3081441 RepID=UPI0030C781AB
MTKEKRTRRLCASLALTVLASTTILTGMAPVVAHAEGETPGEATSSVLVKPSLEGAAAESAPAVDVTAVEDEVEAPIEVEIEDATDVPSLETSVIDKDPGAEEKPAPANDEVMVEETTEDQKTEKAGAPIITLGTWGTVDWTLTNEGELFLMGGTGENTNGYTPWIEISDQVKTVTFQDTVVAPEDCSSLFENFTNVTAYNNIERLDTSLVRQMHYMFSSNKNLSTINLNAFDVTNVHSMDYMFESAGLVSLNLSSWKFNSEVTIHHMFGAMSNLKEVNFGDSNLEGFYADPFGAETNKLERLVLGKEMTLENIPSKPGMYWEGQTTGHIFEDSYYGDHADVYLLTAIPMTGQWGTVAWALDEMGTLTLESGIGADTNYQSPWWMHRDTIKSVVINGEVEAPVNSSYLFSNFTRLTEIKNLNQLDVSNVEDMSCLFLGDTSLTQLNLAEWDMRNVKIMFSAFNGASSLTRLDLSDWKVSDGINISYFLEGTNIEVVDLSGWNVKKVVAHGAFERMSSLQHLDISGISIPDGNSDGLVWEANQLESVVIGNDTYLTDFWVPEGKVWQGESTGHKFGYFYNSGYPDTYRLANGELGYLSLSFKDWTSESDRWWRGPSFYGEIGEQVDLTAVALPEGYELKDAQKELSLLPLDEDGWYEYETIELKQIPKTTTRRITFTGLPEGLVKDVTQEVKWHWEWRYEWEGGMRDSKALSQVDDGWTQVYSPLNHFEAYTVPTVPGYQASVTTVAAEHVDSDEDITELNNAETVTVHYTKLSTGGSENSAGGSNTGVSSSTDSSNITTTTTGTSNADGSLPQTGSAAASGLAALGLGLLGLLGINWRKRRRS